MHPIHVCTCQWVFIVHAWQRMGVFGSLYQRWCGLCCLCCIVRCMCCRGGRYFWRCLTCYSRHAQTEGALQNHRILVQSQRWQSGWHSGFVILLYSGSNTHSYPVHEPPQLDQADVLSGVCVQERRGRKQKHLWGVTSSKEIFIKEFPQFNSSINQSSVDFHSASIYTDDDDA